MEPFLGQIELFPETAKPRNWAPCDGRKLNARQNVSLYHLLGNRFGGDANEFALPDLRGQAPPGLVYLIALQGQFPSPAPR